MKRTKKTNIKKRKGNEVAMAYRIESLPGRVRKDVFLQTLINFLEGEISALPPGWDVTWIWRNSKKQDTREDTFENAISNSRPSFMTLMLRRLRRDLGALRVTIGKHKSSKRAKSKKKRTAKRRKMPKMRRRKSSRNRTKKRRRKA